MFFPIVDWPKLVTSSLCQMVPAKSKGHPVAVQSVFPPRPAPWGVHRGVHWWEILAGLRRCLMVRRRATSKEKIQRHSNTGWWARATPLKNMSASIGMIRNPILMGKSKKWQPVTTNQNRISWAWNSAQCQPLACDWIAEASILGAPMLFIMDVDQDTAVDCIEANLISLAHEVDLFHDPVPLILQ